MGCRAFCLAVLATVLLLSPPGRAAEAGEDVGTRGLSSDAVRLVKQYLSKSDNALGKLVNIVARGKSNSGSAWDSACKSVDAPLAAILGNKEIMTKVRDWAVNEGRAWNRMKSVGGKIAEANEEILERLDLVETSNRISKDELKTVTSEVRSMINTVIDRFKSEIDDVGDASGKIDKLLEGAGMGEDADARKIVTAFGDLGEEVGDIDGSVKKVERLEHYVRRFGDSIRRRKLGFFGDNERLMKQLRRDVAKLVSEKIDPDGRGAFDKVERKIESTVQDNLRDYEKALEEWEKVNKSLMGNAKDFAKEFVAPAMADAVKSLPKVVFGVKVPGWAWKADMALDEAADSWRDWIRSHYTKFTNGYYERLADTLSTWEEDLDLLDVEEKEALDKIDAERNEKVDDFKEESEKETRRLKDELDDKKSELDDLGSDQDSERRSVENEIAMLEKEIEAESVALERRIERHDDEVNEAKDDVKNDYKKKRDELADVIRQLKSAKAGVK